MVKWYLLRNVLLAAVLASVGSGCARSSQTLTGWFDREPKVDAQGKPLSKEEAGKESLASKEKASKKSTAEKEQVADADEAGDGIKKASWFSWGKDDDKAPSSSKEIKSSSKEDKSKSSVASQDSKEKSSTSKSSADSQVAKSDAKASTGSKTPASTESNPTKSTKGLSSTKAFEGTALADTKSDSTLKDTASSEKKAVKPTRGPSRDLIPADEDPFLAEALADIAAGRGNGPERVQNKSESGPVAKSDSAKTAPPKSATSKETTPSKPAADLVAGKSPEKEKVSPNGTQTQVPSKPISEVTGEEDFAAWISKIEGRGEAETKLEKPAQETPSKSEQLVAAVKSGGKIPEAKATQQPTKTFDWAKETPEPQVAQAAAKKGETFAELQSDSAKKIESLSRSLKSSASNARDKAADELMESKAIASTEWANTTNSLREKGENLSGELRKEVKDQAVQFADLATETSEAAAEMAWAQVENEKSRLVASTANATTEAANRIQDAFDWEKETTVTPTAIAKKTGATAPVIKGLIEKCGAISEEVKPLVQGLETSSVDAIRHNVHRLGQMDAKGQEAVPALNALLDHEDPYVKVHSALALSRLGAESPKVLKTLVGGLKSQDSGVRSFSAAVIGELGPLGAEALPALATSLDDPDGYVRLHAAEVLVRNDRFAGRALDTLQNCLKDSDENIRWLATYSLAELAPQRPDTVLCLMKVLNDPAKRVRVGAIYALGEIGALSRVAIPELEQAATDPDQELRAAAQYALQQIKS